MKLNAKKSLLPVLGALLLWTGGTIAQAVEVIGARSWGAWLEYRAQRGSSSVTTEAWLVGYLSGIAISRGKDALKGTDNQSIYAWMDNYCRANPLSFLPEGGQHLFWELVKQKRL